MYTNRSSLTTVLILLCAAVVPAQTGAGRPGREFSASGVPAAPEDGGARNWEVTGVARAGGGYATVVIKKPDGRARAVFFRMGKPVGADTSEADPGRFSAVSESDLDFIRIGDERYEIPAAVVVGG